MHVYGPVPSRRLGRSLGVSPIPPRTCTCSCTYCQHGRTETLTLRRRSFHPREEILEETLQAVSESNPDHVTFCGDGEPTLCRDLGWLIRRVRARAGVPVAVITNGCLLHRMDVRQDLEHADIVMPSLDAGDEATFLALNRPHPGLDFYKVMQGLVRFREGYTGWIWLEIMLVRGLNDTIEALREIQQAVARVRPERVFILTPIRPPAEARVEIPDPAALERARGLIPGAEILCEPESGRLDPCGCPDPRETILGIGSRHPLRREQALEIEASTHSPGLIDGMLEAGELVAVLHDGRPYLIPSGFRRGTSPDSRPAPAGRPRPDTPGRNGPG